MVAVLDPRDVPVLDRPKAESALQRFRIQVVDDPTDPAFDAAYSMLHEFFAPRGELEDREALARFTRERVIHYAPGMEGHYRLIVAWDGDDLAGVRDCYVDLDLPNRLCLAALAHTLVAPRFRRTGLAAVFRALPATLAREAVAERYEDPGSVPILIAAEMEPVELDNLDTVVRLLAYGRSGFKVLDPARVPYSQPDFRDDVVSREGRTGIPLLAVVRWLDHPEATHVPVALAAAFPRLFHVCHRLYLPAWRVDPSEAHALAAIFSSADDVPLLALPTSPGHLESLAPLMREAVLRCYPPVLCGPELGLPAQDQVMGPLRLNFGGAA